MPGISRSPAIAGIGITEMSHRVYGRSSSQFAADAIRLAAADAGLEIKDLDGLLINAGITQGVGLALSHELNMVDLRMLSEIQAYGSSAGAMIQYASMAIANGMADAVACVFGDAPLREGTSTGALYAGEGRKPSGFSALPLASGVRGAPVQYAMAARRHMDKYGTTSEHFGHVAVSSRAWAQMNPRAQMRDPLTLEDHQNSRMIAEPFHLFDCCLVSNGGVAVIVTSGDRASMLQQPPIYVRGWGQTHPGYLPDDSNQQGLVSGAALSGPAAMKMAGVSLSDINVAEIYDCFTFTTLISMEDYGFCEKGEGGEFVASGALAPGGSIPTNTGGGQLSSYYMWGMTPLSEAVIQARGQGGERQVGQHDVVLVSGNGGCLDHHSTLILSSHEN
ncbi:MAG: sterol carrier protein [Frankiales bacterium]|nr:sterol carrier protein [Frankiales bacterium]